MKQKYLSSLFFTLLPLLSIIAQEDCDPPTLTIDTNEYTFCDSGNAVLMATSDGDVIHWYAGENDTTPLTSGEIYQTDIITETTSFWVEATTQILGTSQFGGKPSPTSTGGTTVNPGTSPWGLSFQAYETFILNSVVVFLSSGTPGTIVLHLKDQNYNLLQTFEISAPAGGTSSNPVPFTIPLDVTVEPGTYRLLVESGPSMIRDLSGGNMFPYALGTVGAITGGTINNNPGSNDTVYYFLYNWNFTPYSSCSSEREEIQIIITPTPEAPAADAEQTVEEGSTLEDLEVNGTNLTWYADEDGTIELNSDTAVEDETTYYVTQTINNCTSAPTAITVFFALNTIDYSQNNFQFYPNPVDIEFTIENKHPILSVIIYNSAGQKVLESIHQSSLITLDLAKLTTGLYLVKVETESGDRFFKIQKR